MRIGVALVAGCLAYGSTAVAQESGITVTGVQGGTVALSSAEAYRALSDRIVENGGIIVNSAVNWQQIDTALPPFWIELYLTDGGHRPALLEVVRRGCIEDSADKRACADVGLRDDRLIVGNIGAGLTGVARFEPMAQPAPPPPLTAIPGQYRTQTVANSAGNTTASVQYNVEIAAYTAPPEAPDPIIDMTMIQASPIAAPAARVYATRLFAGRNRFPPEGVAAYGIIAFQTLATSEDEATYIAICEAFFSSLINSTDIVRDSIVEMVTVWPIDDRDNPDLPDALNTTRAGADSCAQAVEFYDIQIARDAIADARRAGQYLTGRGPFLIAWAPGWQKGAPEAIVLAADLSDVQTIREAQDVLAIWRSDIEQDPSLWENGFTAEKLRVKLRQIVNRYGEGLLRFFGG